MGGAGTVMWKDGARGAGRQVNERIGVRVVTRRRVNGCMQGREGNGIWAISAHVAA